MSEHGQEDAEEAGEKRCAGNLTPCMRQSSLPVPSTALYRISMHMPIARVAQALANTLPAYRCDGTSKRNGLTDDLKGATSRVLKAGLFLASYLA